MRNDPFNIVIMRNIKDRIKNIIGRKDKMNREQPKEKKFYIWKPDKNRGSVPRHKHIICLVLKIDDYDEIKKERKKKLFIHQILSIS